MITVGFHAHVKSIIIKTGTWRDTILLDVPWAHGFIGLWLTGYDHLIRMSVHFQLIVAKIPETQMVVPVVCTRNS
jgi:hypothetical protein